MQEPAPEVPLQAVDQHRYEWVPTPDDPLSVKRYAWGEEIIEDIWNRYNHGEQNLFLVTDVSFASPVPAERLVRAAQEAWIALRYEAPIIAARTEQDERDDTIIAYTAARDADVARAWAERTVRVVERRGRTLDEVRTEVGQHPIPDAHGEQTFIYLSPRSETECAVLLYTSHVPFDGRCTMIIVRRFLKNLAQCLADPAMLAKANDGLAWGKEMVNLHPAAFKVLGEDEVRQARGPEYKETLDSITKDMTAAMPRMQGFKKRNIGPGLTKRSSRQLTAEDTANLLSFARAHGLTIGQITHAALMMVCAADNPPAPGSDSAFVSYGLMDSRPRLAPAYAGRDGYLGYCLAMSPIVVPVSVLDGPAGKQEGKAKGDIRISQLMRLSEAVRAEYRKQKAYPAVEAVQGELVDWLLAPMKKQGIVPPPWMGPFYTSDGPGENFLDYTYADEKGTRVLVVDDFFTSLNKTDPGPFFRTASWRGRLHLGVDFNEHAMPPEVVEGWMDHWAELVALAIKEGYAIPQSQRCVDSIPSLANSKSLKRSQSWVWKVVNWFFGW